MIHLSAQVERWTDAVDEMRHMFPLHWEELALDKDVIPLEPDYPRYAELDAQGALSVVTLRDRGSLAGYCVMLLGRSLHYASSYEAKMDMFWLHPNCRGRLGGLRLFRAVEAELKRRGVGRIFVGSKVHRDTSRLFLALGYRPTEAWFSKLVER